MTQKEKIKVLRDLGCDVQVIDGKPTVKGWLDLIDRGITSLPDNLVVGGHLDIKTCSEITSLPNNLVVGGWFDISGTKITSLPDNLIVSSSLYLGNTKITSLPNNLAVGGWLDLSGSEITSLPDNLVVGGSLDLRGSEITSLPNNLVVGGGLFLNNTKIKSLPDNLIVGGGLCLCDTDITSLPDNLIVGGWIIKSNGDRIYRNQNPKIDFVQKIWGDKPYCCVDGIFTEVINRRGKVWEVRRIGHTETLYIVNDGNGNYAHARTIEQAKADLIYKITNKDKSKYESLTLDSTLAHEEAIQCYRTITGACSFGTKNFVENVLPPEERKDQYTIAEIIHLTKGRYGNEIFTKFFKDKK